MDFNKVGSNLSKGKWVFLFLALYAALWAVGSFYAIPLFSEYSGGPSILDATSNYTPGYAYTLLEKLGEEGRAFYLSEILMLDFIYPLAVCLFFSSLILFLLRKAGSSLNGLLITPLLVLIFDFVENILLLSVLFSYPARMDVIVTAANVFTVLKSFMGLALLFVVLLSLILVIVKAIRKKLAPA